jgi:hypothetical protein
MKANKVQDFNIDELVSPHNMSKERSALMKRFWAENSWAKKSFSKNMEYAWKKVKEEQDMFYIINVTPKGFKQKFFAWCRKEGIDTSELSFDFHKYYPHKPELNCSDEMVEAMNRINKYTPKFIDACPGDESKKLANTLFLALLKFGKHLKSLEGASNITSESQITMLAIRKFIRSELFDTSSIAGFPNPKVLDAQEVQHLYSTIMTMLMDKHENKLIGKLSSLMDESYDYLTKKWDGGGIILQPDAHMF